MDKKISQILFLLLRQVLRKDLVQNNDIDCSSNTLEELLYLSRQHDIAQIVSVALISNQSIVKTNRCDEIIQQAIISSVYRYERMNYEFKTLVSVFEENQISFIPLKGAIVRGYYPEPWMRTSGDIDILVHPEDLPKAVSILVKELDYKEGEKGSHDVSLHSPSKIHVELHYKLVEKGWAQNSCLVLEQVWDYVIQREGYKYWYDMSDDMFYFYHIAHMTKHFEQGGCGIKPYLDLWILDNVKGGDREKINNLLIQGGLLRFSEVSRKLSRVWLEGEKSDATTEKMQEYVLNGGVQGNTENRIAIQQQQKGGVVPYVFSKIFIPYEIIKFQYPVLQKYRWLTPIMEVRRWGKLIFCGHASRVTKELQYGTRISKVEAEDMSAFLNEIGLR